MWDKLTSAALIDPLSNQNITKKCSSIGHEGVENSLESLQYMTEERLYLGQQCASSSSGVFNATTDTNTSSQEDVQQEDEDSDPDVTLVDKSEATSSDHTQSFFRRTTVLQHTAGLRNSMNPPSSLIWNRESPSPKWMSLSCPTITGVLQFADRTELISKENDSVSDPSDDEVISDSEDESLADEDINSGRQIDCKSKMSSTVKGQSFIKRDQELLKDDDIDFLYRRSFVDTSTYSMFSSEDSGTDENYPGHPSEVSGYSFSETSSRVSGSSDYLLMPLASSDRNNSRRPMLGPPPVTLLRRSPGVVGMSSLSQKTDAELEALMLQASQKRHQVYQLHENSPHSWQCALLSNESPVTKSSEASREEFDIPYMDETDSDDEAVLFQNKVGNKVLNLSVKRAEMDDCSLDVLTEVCISSTKGTMQDKRLKNVSSHQHISKKKRYIHSFTSHWSQRLLKFCSCTRPQLYEND